MNIVLCIAIYLSMPVDYNRYHTCNQDSYQPAIPNQVCVCRTTSPHSQARSVKQCVRRRICEVSYKNSTTFFPPIYLAILLPDIFSSSVLLSLFLQIYPSFFFPS